MPGMDPQAQALYPLNPQPSTREVLRPETRPAANVTIGPRLRDL